MTLPTPATGTYRHRIDRSLVSAVHLDVRDVAPVAAWCDGTAAEDGLSIAVGDDAATPGDWILRDEDGGHIVLSDVAFGAIYEAATT